VEIDWAVALSSLSKPTKGQANLYGIILYTDAHAHIKKVLADHDYWLALDEVSGPRWVVYAARAAQGHLEWPKVRPGALGLMVPVWREPRENLELISGLGIDSSRDLPSLLVFACDEKDRVWRRFVKLSDASVLAAYDSLKVAMADVALALEQMSDKYRRVDARAFHVVGYRLDSRREWELMKTAVSAWEWLRSMWPT
jgi:hypothetical protein